MKTILRAFRTFIVLSFVTGVLYPLSVTAAVQVFFPKQAGGSLVYRGGKLTGSSLLAQKFQNERYFWPRPSAGDYAAVPSGASNLGPTSAALKEAAGQRAEAFNRAHGTASAPSGMIFASGSGLDPHITPEEAKLQIPRVAKARGLGETVLQRLVDRCTEGPQFGVFGKSRVNVLNLNIALDSL